MIIPPRRNRRFLLSVWVLLALPLFFASSASAAYTTYAPGQTVVLGDFVYDDDYTATTTNCYVSIWGPSGSVEVNAASMSAGADSFYSYSYSTSTHGTFPAQMSCGYAGDGSLVKQDKTFIVATSSATIPTAQEVADIVNENTNSVVLAASSSLGTSLTSVLSTLASIPASIWSYGTRSLSTFGSLAADVWSAATRTLTGAGLDTGSLATLSDVQTASSSVAAVVNANTSSVVATASSSIGSAVDALDTLSAADLATASSSIAAVVNANTNSIVLAASSSLGSVISSVASSVSGIPAAVWAAGGRTLSSFGTLAADVWSSGTRTLTGAGLDTGSLATQSDIGTASSSVAAVVNANTNNTVSTASSSVAAVVNANTNSTVSTASSSIAATVNSNTNSIVLVASSSLGAAISSVASAVTGIPAAVWDYSGRTLTSFSTLAADVWASGTRTLTGAGLSSGSLATQSDVGTASSSVAAVVNANTNSAVSTASSSIAATVNTNTVAAINTASSSVASVVNANTNSIVLAASSSLGSVISSVASSVSGIPAAVWAAGGRTLSSFGTLAADVWSSGTRTLTGAGLDTGSLATQSDVQTASSSVAAVVNANTNTQTASLSSTVSTASSSLAAVVNANTNSVVLAASSSLGSSLASLVGSVASLPAAVWNVATTTLTSPGTVGKLIVDNLDAAISGISGAGSLTAADIWTYAARSLTTAALTSGSLATLSDVQTASSSVAAVVNANTNSVVTTASSSIGSAIGNISAASNGWLVQMSDFDSALAGDVYRARVTTLYGSTLTAPNTAPAITVYDADRNTVVSGVAMTLLSTGVYEYTYTTSGSAAEGTWESVVSTQVESGKTIQTNDYWSVVSAPAQVLIQSMGSTETPSISANIRITNEGSVDYEYQYEWCVVSSVSNACGGGDDTYYASAAKLIDSGDDFDTTLSATVPLAGTYYFKTVAYFGADSSVASRQFVATAPASSGGGGSGGGGGGGGGGGSSNTRSESTPAASAPADINGDAKVNGTDFSILLAFWKTPGPFKNAAVDLNRDNKIDSVDFSILLYRWSK